MITIILYTETIHFPRYSLANLLVYFLGHNIRPENHSGSKIIVNCARASGIVNNGNHVVLTIHRNFSNI